jgi:hypothetical protein
LLDKIKKLFTRDKKPAGHTFSAGSGISANYFPSRG